MQKGKNRKKKVKAKNLPFPTALQKAEQQLHFERLITSIDRLETFKSFIDEQVKDN